MSKLFKLKEWLTVPDAARHLSIAFGEDVSEADVLRLALDGHLKLSVNFVNHARARRGKVVSWMETEWGIFPCINKKAIKEIEAKIEASAPHKKVWESPPKLLEIMGEISDDEKDDFSTYMCSLNIDDERFLNLDKEVTVISGVWDLPMIGGDRLDIEHRYQQLTGGPAVTLQVMDGAFIEGADGVMCQIQESFDDNEYQLGSKAQLREMKVRIAIEEIEESEAQKLLDKHKQDRKIFLEKQDTQNKSNNYYPKGGLPDDSVFVVRTTALRDFEQSINDVPANADKPLTNIERDSLLKLVIGMAMKGYSYDPTAKKNSAVADITADLALLGLPLGDDTVRKYLKQGNEKLPEKPTTT